MEDDIFYGYRGQRRCILVVTESLRVATSLLLYNSHENILLIRQRGLVYIFSSFPADNAISCAKEETSEAGNTELIIGQDRRDEKVPLEFTCPSIFNIAFVFISKPNYSYLIDLWTTMYVYETHMQMNHCDWYTAWLRMWKTSLLEYRVEYLLPIREKNEISY